MLLAALGLNACKTAGKHIKQLGWSWGMLPQANLNLEAISRGLVSPPILHFRLLGICVCSIGSSKFANIYGLLATELTLVARACAPVCHSLAMPLPVSCIYCENDASKICMGMVHSGEWTLWPS